MSGTWFALLCVLLSPMAVAGQASPTLITESTVTWGRGGFAYQGPGSDAVGIADLGLRWAYPSGVGWGLSMAGGYDLANEAVLLGGRGRYGWSWREYRWEGSLALLYSSLDEGGVGGNLGLAFYPRPWGALVLQLDHMATADDSDFAVSYGLRIAERPALASWAAAGLVGLAAWAFAGELGCC